MCGVQPADGNHLIRRPLLVPFRVCPRYTARISPSVAATIPAAKGPVGSLPDAYAS